LEKDEKDRIYDFTGSRPAADQLCFKEGTSGLPGR
jgi:hypothetical protein